MTEKKNSEYEDESHTCETYSTITDLERGEMVCGGCGLILVQNMPDTSYQGNGFSYEDFTKQSRTGPAISLTMYDKGLSTMIGKNTDSTGTALSSKTKHEFNRLRIWDQRSKSRDTTRLSKGLTTLHGMKTKLGVPDNVIENAAYIYRKAVSAGMTRGRTTSSLVAASLYAACRKHGIPRTLDDIADVGNVEKKILSRDLRMLIKKLELELDQYNPTSFISKISNNLNLKEKIKRDAINILKRCEEQRITAGKHPVAQAAAVLYLASLLNDQTLNQKQLAKESGISEVTIRNIVVSMKKAKIAN